MDGFVVLASIEEAGEPFISVETTADVVGGVAAVGFELSDTVDQWSRSETCRQVGGRCA